MKKHFDWRYLLSFLGLFLASFILAKISSDSLPMVWPSSLAFMQYLELFAFMPPAFVLAFSMNHLASRGKLNVTSRQSEQDW